MSCCISFDSYIKPQLFRFIAHTPSVVSLLIPTSNHNSVCVNSLIEALSLFWFLHQTTTLVGALTLAKSCISFDSYIKPQPVGLNDYITFVVSLLIPTSNHNSGAGVFFCSTLYLFWFLHQTTTCPAVCCLLVGCISFDSYIKPQPVCMPASLSIVVSLLIPTSNHN